MRKDLQDVARCLMLLAVTAPLYWAGSATAETPDRPGIETPIDTPADTSTGTSADTSNTTTTPAAPTAATPTTAAATAATEHVEIDNFDFAPMTLTVSAGTTVTWTNHDDDPHTVLSSDKPAVFKSPPLDTDDSYSFTFTKPGTYHYFCSVHPKMQGTVVVTTQP